MYEKLYQWLDAANEKLSFNPDLQKLFRNCFVSTLETTVERKSDGGTFVFTGDIPAMWLRDSSVQVSHYLQFAALDDDVREMILGLIKRQMKYIRLDPYANAFNAEPNGHGHNDITVKSDWVWERKYELDSLVYPLWLIDRYYKATKDDAVFGSDFYETLSVILSVIETEQHHEEKSTYSFIRGDENDINSLGNGGKGDAVGYTGMSWCAFRPSDDRCKYHYLIPSNLFAIATLDKIQSDIENEKFRERIGKIVKEIHEGIEKYGVIQHEKYGEIYAYETDGLGHYNIMDDANVPSLLSLPYLDYCSIDDKRYQNTRKMILSKDNPYFYEGSFARGVGSPHTPKDYIWHMSLIMQALTSENTEEIRAISKQIFATTMKRFCVHESFHCDDPDKYTREWFAWANTLFAVFVIKNLDRAEELFG